MNRESLTELAVERDILIKEIQLNPDILPGDKDHLRQAINSAYDAAENDDINELSASNIVWSRLNLRTFASVQKLVIAVRGLSYDIRVHVNAAATTTPAQIAEESNLFERRLNAITRLARVAAWPVCALAAIIATAFILRPELAKVASEMIKK